MNFLLDTHILLWWLGDSPQLSAEIKEVIINPENLIFVSAATVWEMTIKQAIGKLSIPNNLLKMLLINDFQILNITAEHGLKVAELPDYHKDPFDRMLIAQALWEDLTLISRDEKFTFYDVSLLMA
jgi:PIN domain nuclease of toxin-antitoxin system